MNPKKSGEKKKKEQKSQMSAGDLPSDEQCKALLSLSVPDFLLYLCNVSSRAYGNDMSILLRAHFTEWKMIEKDGAQGHVASSPYAVLLAFRGTEVKAKSDVAADLDTEKVGYNNGKVHRGFWREAEKLKPMVVEWVLNHPNRPIIITGHSLGGAISVVMARILEREMNCKAMNLVTFGCPMVGDEKFVGGVKSRHIRVGNENDVVTTVPPGKPWTHHGELVFLDGGKYRTGLVGKAVARARMKIGAVRFFTCVPFSGVKAHLLENYLGNLFTAIKSKRALDISPLVFEPSFIPAVPDSLAPPKIDPLPSLIEYDQK
jgi:hypothetical protein